MYTLLTRISTFPGLLLMICLFVQPVCLHAVPAFPGSIEFRQPDGNIIEIYLMGDEKVNWARTPEGYTLLATQKGEMQYAITDATGDLVASGIAVGSIHWRSDEEQILLQTLQKNLFFSERQLELMHSVWKEKSKLTRNGFPTTGQQKMVCILMQTPDMPFIQGKEAFEALFNQLNYTLDGAAGSVRDYYLENSWGQLDLIIDVFGPYTASQSMSHYGSYIGARQLLAEGIQLANADVNFADYDINGNGSVDGLHMIFAGYGQEASGAPNTIWSHASLIIPAISVDGVFINRYSCSPERRGNAFNNPAGAITRIGVVAHEIGHIFGAPDFYDTDGAGSGGQYQGTGYWDMMSMGTWNNLGATPAHHNPYTKTQIYQWTQPYLLFEPMDVLMHNSVDDSSAIYRINTPVEGEYFLLENRQLTGFDSHIPGHGLMIYHVHANIGQAGNDVNAGHPQKFYPVNAAAEQSPNANPISYGEINSTATPFPGSSNIMQFTGFTPPYLRSWENFILNTPLSEIIENTNDKTISFRFMDQPDVKQWLFRDDGNRSKSVGTSSGGLFQAAIRYTPDQLAYYQSVEITGIKVYVVDSPISARIKIWQGNDMAALTEMKSQDFDHQPGQWNFIVLNEPFVADMNKELWIGVEYDDPGTGVFPAGRDQHTNFDGFGNLVRLNVDDPSGWALLTDYNVPGDWNIRAMMETGKEIEFFLVQVEAIPPQGGNVEGNGSFLWNTIHTVKAHAHDGFQFVHWTENGEILSENEEYVFAVNGHKNISAVFATPSLADEQQYQDGFFSVYPNPATNRLTIAFNGAYQPDTRVFIYNLAGQKVTEIHWSPSNESNLTIDISQFPAGVYIMSAETQNYRAVKKIIKKN